MTQPRNFHTMVKQHGRVLDPSDAPLIDAHRISDKLWVGSAPDPQNTDLRFFDVVVLCAQEYQPSGFPCRVIHAGFDDALEPTTKDLHTANHAAILVNMQRAANRRVLVSCIEGRNRSALVAALCLVKQGLAPGLAVAQVRRLRQHPDGAKILSNQAFVRFIDHVGRNTVRP